MLKMIVAMTDEGLIGDRSTNKMPWHISEELKFFKKTTLNHSIVMGRKTAESVGPLPQRNNYVLSRSNEVEGFKTVTVEEVLELSKTEDVFICGGLEIYELFINHYNEIYISVIKIEPDFVKEENKITIRNLFESMYTEIKCEVIYDTEEFLVLKVVVYG